MCIYMNKLQNNETSYSNFVIKLVLLGKYYGFPSPICVVQKPVN